MIDKKFQSILWEYDISKLNYDDNIVFVRTLMFWDKEHIVKLKKELGIIKIRDKFIENVEKLDKKTINYWSKIFNLNIDLKDKQTVYEQLNKPIFTRSFNWR